jgi:hypothetical protein
MSGTGYKALGFLVWHGGKWYLKHRYRLVRRVAGGTLLAVAAAVAGVVVAQRRGATGKA